MSGRHSVILFMTLCRYKKNDLMSARHYFIILPTQIHNKNDTTVGQILHTKNHRHYVKNRRYVNRR
jgi:hypothetical protein